MAIIEEEMQRGQQMQPQAQPAPQQARANPKAVQSVQKLGVSMMKVIYDDPKRTAELLQIIAKSEDPVAGVVQASMLVLGGMGEKMKGVSPKAAFAVLPAAVALLFELADAAKILQFEPSMMQKAQAMIDQKMGGQQPAAPAAPAAPAEEVPAEAPETEEVEA